MFVKGLMILISRIVKAVRGQDNKKPGELSSSPGFFCSRGSTLLEGHAPITRADSQGRPATV